MAGIQDVGTITAWTPARLTRYIQNELNQRNQIGKTSVSTDQQFVHNSLTFSSGDFQTADTIVTRPSTGVLWMNGAPIINGLTYPQVFKGQLYRDDIAGTFGDTNSFIHMRRRTSIPRAGGNNTIQVQTSNKGPLVTGDFAFGIVSNMVDDFTVPASPGTVSNLTNNGSGLIRANVTAHGFATGDYIAIYGAGGTTEANGSWQITVIDANNFDLIGSAFVNTYTGGGLVTNRGGMYGYMATVSPIQARGGLTGNAVSADDVNGYGAFNGSSNQTKALSAYLVNRNSAFGTNDEWQGGFVIEGNCVTGISVGSKCSQFGLDFTAENSGLASYGIGALNLPNSVSVYSTNGAGNNWIQLFCGNSINELQFFPPVRFSSGTVNFQVATNMGIADGSQMFLGSTNGLKIGTATTQKIGFFNATPVAQQAGTGNTHTVTAGATTAVFTNTTFDGSTGSTAYTVGDIVKALKNLGLLAA